jgi:2-keto-3-deoxy-L-rhamnonate aldolase RhmA
MFGAAQLVPSPVISELCVWSGFDFVLIDCEHGVIDEAAQLSCLQVIGAHGGMSAVRIRAGDLAAVGRYLDFGADAIFMPDVRTAQEAAAFVAAGTFGPEGSRSSTSGGVRARRYGLPQPPLCARPGLFALIESRAAVEAIDEIAATPGLSGLVIGPQDLSADLGCEGDFADQAYVAAFGLAEAAARAAGLVLGSRPNPRYPATRLIEAGHRLILLGADIAALREGLGAMLTAAKAS